jgi:hypothetical protein
MKKRGLLILTVLLLVTFLAPQAFAQYNRTAVVNAMRNSYGLVQEINKAIGSQDYYTAGVKLMGLAEVHKALTEVSPPKGSKAEWDRIHNDLVAAAFRAIGAAGERDAAKLQAEMGRIFALNKEGHDKFKG